MLTMSLHLRKGSEFKPDKKSNFKVRQTGCKTEFCFVFLTKSQTISDLMTKKKKAANGIYLKSKLIMWMFLCYKDNR